MCTQLNRNPVQYIHKFQGDSLTTTCVDSTANRKNVVLVCNASTYTDVNILPMVNSDFEFTLLKQKESTYDSLLFVHDSNIHVSCIAFSKGGYAISDEMCVNYIHYYPRAELEVCKSSVTTQSLYGLFNFLHE